MFGFSCIFMSDNFKYNNHLFWAFRLYQDPNIRVLHLLIVWYARLNHQNLSTNGWEIDKNDEKNLYGDRVGDNTLIMTPKFIVSPYLNRVIIAREPVYIWREIIGWCLPV